jgi:hypothetical protein
MKHENDVLCLLIGEIIALYFGAVFPNEPRDRSKIDHNMFFVDQWTTAGAYINLKRRPEFKVRGHAARLWSGTWFDLNDCSVSAAIIIYVEDGYLTTIEIAAAGAEFPDKITSFELSA